MRTPAFALALLMSGTAIAQTADYGTDADATTQTGTSADMSTQDSATQGSTDMSTHGTADMSTQSTADTSTQASSDMSAQASMAPAGSMIVQPSNANPERDARGIAVISAAAMVPAGWNGTAATGMGGPLVDTSGQPVADSSYPACSATVTDKCLQAYERGRG